MKKASTAAKKTPATSKAVRKLAPQTKKAAPAAKPKKATAAAKSRDIREDRGARQMKTSHNPQTLPHARKA